MKAFPKSRLVDKKGFPAPLKANCCQCQKKITVKFILPRQEYSKKNDWGHWTDRPENQGKYICDACLLNLYHQDKLAYWELVVDSKKRQSIRTYIYNGTIA